MKNTTLELPLLQIMGPTASGKSQLALALAKKIPAEIISVDSVMIYRGMDIGSAKPSLKEQQSQPHHLLDILDPSQTYSAGQFCQDASALIKNIQQRGKFPILVGGTMLYFKALQFGIAKLPPACATLRKQLQALKQLHGSPYLWQQLHTVDPTTANRLNPNDSQRIERALEVFQLSNKPLSSWLDASKKEHPNKHHFLSCALMPDNRSMLHECINQRLDTMFTQDWLNEAEKLYQQNLDPKLPAMRAVGYQQMWPYFQGQYNLQTLRNRILFATRQLAKRQLTWLKPWPELHSISMTLPLEEKCNTILAKIKHLETAVHPSS
jgi:tRNA dimethylallyltransferase